MSAEQGIEVGLRPGEIHRLHRHRVDWLMSRIQVIDVMRQHGLRQLPGLPKSGSYRRGSCGPAAWWLVQDGVPLLDVQALLGHEDYATTQRYAHLAC